MVILHICDFQALHLEVFIIIMLSYWHYTTRFLIVFGTAGSIGETVGHTFNWSRYWYQYCQYIFTKYI